MQIKCIWSLCTLIAFVTKIAPMSTDWEDRAAASFKTTSTCRQWFGITTCKLTPAEKERPFIYGFDGYIKNESFLDSYQSYGQLQAQMLFYPNRPFYDRYGRDINAKGRFNMIAFETRLRGEIAGPDVGKAQTWGVLEVDAWASCANLIGIVRVRHAFMYFDWGTSKLLMGQYWHPIVVEGCFAETVSYNTGTPFDPYSRDAQIRFVKRFGTVDLTFALLSHASFRYPGPPIDTREYGYVTRCSNLDSLYTRNAILPNAHVRVEKIFGDHHVGVGVDVTRLVPRLVTDKNFRVTESLISPIVLAYAIFHWQTFDLRLKSIYAQNGAAYDMMGGYAVSGIDPVTDARTYTNLSCISVWADMVHKGRVETGLFVGYLKNIGASQPIIPSIVDSYGQCQSLIYAHGREDVDYAFRFSPRLRWAQRPLILGIELEYTRAAFGTVTRTGRVDRTTSSNNLRLLVATYYFF